MGRLSGPRARTRLSGQHGQLMPSQLLVICGTSGRITLRNAASCLGILSRMRELVGTPSGSAFGSYLWWTAAYQYIGMQRYIAQQWLVDNTFGQQMRRGRHMTLWCDSIMFHLNVIAIWQLLHCHLRLGRLHRKTTSAGLYLHQITLWNGRLIQIDVQHLHGLRLWRSRLCARRLADGGARSGLQFHMVCWPQRQCIIIYGLLSHVCLMLCRRWRRCSLIEQRACARKLGWGL